MRPCEGCAVAGRGCGAPLACDKRDIRMRFGGLAACFPDSPAVFQLMRFKSEAFLTLRFQEIAGGHGNAGVARGGVCQRVGLGVRSARSSRPCGARPGTGLAEPAERPRRERERPQRTWSGAEGDCAADTRSCGGRPARGAAGAWSKTDRAPPCGSMWAGSCAAAGLACGTRAPTTGGAMRSADLWAARRSERPWREPPAYADRIGRSAFDSSYSRNRDRRITALSRACTCESGGNGAGTSAIDSKGESAGAGISGSTGSL